jgi:ubiquinone/menaquinone biosynthesis C-methylase UbiE
MTTQQIMSTAAPTGNVTLFTAVDRTSDPEFFTRFLDEANRLVAGSKQLVLDGLRLRPGQAVLDLGCGTGADVAALARIVGDGGQAVGIDVSESLIAEAQRRWDDSGLPVEFRVGDAQALDVEDASFDACRIERMLMHVPDEQQSIAEAVRVTRGGGRIVAFDFDWDTLIVDSPHKETTRAIARSFSDGIRHGWIGRQMPRLFREHGLADVTVEPYQVFVPLEFFELLLGGHLVHAQEAGVVRAADVERWWTDLRAAADSGDFLATFTAFIVAGTKR